MRDLGNPTTSTNKAQCFLQNSSTNMTAVKDEITEGIKSALEKNTACNYTRWPKSSFFVPGNYGPVRRPRLLGLLQYHAFFPHRDVVIYLK